MTRPTDSEAVFRSAIDHMVALWCLGSGVTAGEVVTVAAEVADDDTLTLVIGIGAEAARRMTAEHGGPPPWRPMPIPLSDPTPGPPEFAPRHGANGDPAGTRELLAWLTEDDDAHGPDGPARYWPVERQRDQGGE